MDIERDLEDIIERYQSRRKLRNSINKYKERKEGRLKARREDDWVTIGGGPGPHGEEHSGGAHVNIENGVIKEGPKDLKGEKVNEIAKPAKKNEVYKSPDGKRAVKFNASDGTSFEAQLHETKATVDADKRWRVSDTDHSAKDYDNMQCYVTENGSTVAVTKDGDIVSVCVKKGSGDYGKDLIGFAVEKGGNKLDAFSGIWDFYLKQGFEPVSWIPFSMKYKPPGWLEQYKAGNVGKEPVVFFRYVGHPVEMDKTWFYENVAPSRSYVYAEKARDRAIKKGKGNKVEKGKELKYDSKLNIPSYDEYERRVYELWMNKWGAGSPEQRKKDFFSEDGQWYVKRGYKNAIDGARRYGGDVLSEAVLNEAILSSMSMEFGG